ncbi:MAG TPA: protein phosphatase CheZ [Steroidobacteraceae bacterium]|nr:protein phosphatase CheZ [Steroidobacteraceae bacterium]
MSQDDTLQARYRSIVTDLAGALDRNDEGAFRGAFDRLRSQLNLDLNPELKRITADAQSALRRFREQARLEVLADQEVPDARRRLAHVVKLTEEAAHRTLDLVEQSTPLVDRMSVEAAQLLEEWGLHGSRQLAVNTLWPERATESLERAVRDTERVRRFLSQMLLAQGYQDLSGQIISSVITLVIELERVLGELVSLAHGEDTRRMPALRLEQTQPQPELNGTGPHVPGVSRGQHLDSQDDIDALLASVASGK